MAYFLTPPPPIATPPISARCTKKTQFQILGSQRVLACQTGPNQAVNDTHVPRRVTLLGLGGALVGLILGDNRASVAAGMNRLSSARDKKDPKPKVFRENKP